MSGMCGASDGSGDGDGERGSRACEGDRGSGGAQSAPALTAAAAPGDSDGAADAHRPEEATGHKDQATCRTTKPPERETVPTREDRHRRCGRRRATAPPRPDEGDRRSRRPARTGSPRRVPPRQGQRPARCGSKPTDARTPPHEKRHARALRGRREHRQRRLAAEETRPTATAGTTPRRRRQRIRPGRQTRPPGERPLDVEIRRHDGDTGDGWAHRPAKRGDGEGVPPLLQRRPASGRRGGVPDTYPAKHHPDRPLPRDQHRHGDRRDVRSVTL